MSEFVKVLNGKDKVTCNTQNWRKFVAISFADSCPEGYLPVCKAKDKPTPGNGELLWFSYSVNDGKIDKTYFCAPPPRRWSRLTIKRGLSELGMWDEFKTALVSSDFFDEFLMCDYVEEFDESFNMMYSFMCEKHGKDLVDEILAMLECV